MDIEPDMRLIERLNRYKNKEIYVQILGAGKYSFIGVPVHVGYDYFILKNKYGDYINCNIQNVVWFQLYVENKE